MSRGEKVLIDGSELIKWESPFKNRLLGKVRRSIYFLLYPTLKNNTSKLYLGDSELFIEKLNAKRKFTPAEMASQHELNHLDKKNLIKIKEFMLDNEIEYFILYYENWWKTKSELKEAGFNRLMSSNSFILSSVKTSKPEPEKTSLN